MERRRFYDVRSMEAPSGVFDLRLLPAPARRNFNRLLQRLCQQHGLEGASITDSGLVVIPEPSYGANPVWNQEVFDLQRGIEVALGRRIQMLLRIERVYLMNFMAFKKSDWQAMGLLFSQLPEWKGGEPLPHWFGQRGDEPPRIWAQITRSGLHVNGLLSRGRWVGWDTWLRRNMDQFPAIQSV